MALLRFMYLTLPNCAGKLLKTLSKEEKQEKSTKRQKDEFTRLQLAMASSKSKQRQESIFTHLQFASSSQWRVAPTSKGRKAYSLASSSPPTRNGE